MSKRILLLLTMLVFAFTTINTSKAQDNLGACHKGAKSFTFMYTPFQSNLGLISSGSFGETTNTGEITNTPLAGVGFQYYLSDYWVLGAAVHAGVTKTTNNTNITTTTTTLGIDAGLSYQLKSLYNVSPYVGAGINYGMRNITSAGTTLKGESFGIGVNTGFDWFFTNAISIGGRYTLGAQVSTVKDLPGSTVQFGTGVTSVVLNAYF